MSPAPDRTGPVRRYVVRLYERHRPLKPVRSWVASFDLWTDDALRLQLNEAVRSHKGTLDVDLARWRIVVHQFKREPVAGKPLPAGRVLARVRVNALGQTIVTSRARRKVT